MKNKVIFHKGGAMDALAMPITSLLACILDAPKRNSMSTEFEHDTVLVYLRSQGLFLLHAASQKKEWATELLQQLEKHGIHRDHIMMILYFQWERLYEVPEEIELVKTHALKHTFGQ